MRYHVFQAAVTVACCAAGYAAGEYYVSQVTIAALAVQILSVNLYGYFKKGIKLYNEYQDKRLKNLIIKMSKIKNDIKRQEMIMNTAKEMRKSKKARKQVAPAVPVA